jgi:hypothetical protein
MSDFRTRIPCKQVNSFSKLSNVLTAEYGDMHYKLKTEKNERGELFYVVGVSCHFARDVRELLITKGVLREGARPRGFSAINKPKPGGDSLPEVIDLTGDDSDGEALQAQSHEEPNAENIPGELTSGSRQRHPVLGQTPGSIAKSASNQRDTTERMHQSTALQIPYHRRVEQRRNSAVGQGDCPTGRVPISMLLEDPQT